MNIQEIQGEVCRYHVSSDSDPSVTYMVDLLEHHPLGSCSCRDWVTRRLPDFRRNGTTTTCKHVRACREHFTNDVLESMLEQELKR